MAVKPKVVENNNEPAIHRPARVTPEVAQILTAMGIVLPADLLEIKTEVEKSDDIRQILIPRSMSKLEASDELKRQYQNEEQVINTVCNLEGWNWKDGLVAIKRTTEEIFGWINGVPSWWKPPTEIEIVVDLDKRGKPVTERAYLNQFILAPWDKATATVGVSMGSATITITAKRKFADEVTQYFNLIRKRLETSSIYKGRSLVVTRDDNFGAVQFEIIDNRPSDKIVLNRNTALVLDNFVYGAMEDVGKRTYLFTGNYGNGKTETAMAVGRYAVRELGMSFFYVKDSDVFEQLLVQSKKYQPCVIFLEDIDEIAAGEERDKKINEMLNVLDGVSTKGHNLTTIFTTNHPRRINTAMRRPGRIDLVVQFDNPETEPRKKIMELYFMGLEGSDRLDYDLLETELPKAQGAVIAEICKRSVKLAEREGAISEDTVRACIESMRYQIELMDEAPVERNDYEMFFHLLGRFISPEFQSELNKSQLAAKIKNTRSDVKEIRATTADVNYRVGDIQLGIGELKKDTNILKKDTAILKDGLL